MKYNIPKDLNGVLYSKEDENRIYAFFNLKNNVVTILFIDINKEYIEKCNKEDDEDEWLYGIAEDGSYIAFLNMGGYDINPSINKSAPVCIATFKFFTPLIIKNNRPFNTAIETFNVIEFRGEIIDDLYSPNNILIEEIDPEKGIQINFKDPKLYTKGYNIKLNSTNQKNEQIKEQFILEYSVCMNDLTKKMNENLDLKNEIHSVIRFKFQTEQPLMTIETYYLYALKLCQFCTKQQNVKFEIRLYKKEFLSSPILVAYKDAYNDYYRNNNIIGNIITLPSLGEKLPQLFKILIDNKKSPHMLFLPDSNERNRSIYYTNVTDICIAFEKEYNLLSDKNEIDKENKEAAKELTQKLINLIQEQEDCPEKVVSKATNLINTQLKGFTPSLKEKIITLYEEFELPLKKVTEIKNHDIYGIQKFYTKDEFKEHIKQFIDIRNKASHVGIHWNEGIKIYYHLQVLVYLCILNRAGYTKEESSLILQNLFVSYF